MNNYIGYGEQFTSITDKTIHIDRDGLFFNVKVGEIFHLTINHYASFARPRFGFSDKKVTFVFLTTPENKRRSSFFALSFDRLIICKIYVIELPESQISRNHRDDKQFCYDIYT